MKIHFQPEVLQSIPEANQLFTALNSLSNDSLDLENADLYYDFPLYRDDDDQLISTHLMLISEVYGVIIFYFSAAVTSNYRAVLIQDDENLEHVYGHVYSRLMKQKSLRKNRRELLLNVESLIFAPFIQDAEESVDTDSEVISSQMQLENFISNCEHRTGEFVYGHAASTLEGGKGLLKPKDRNTDGYSIDSKIAMVSELETKLARFDSNQLMNSINEVIGTERIRGLAGSGKTVILAMKAALTHIRYPEAKILYTFSTKSLHQHVKRLITRFYRQFNDTDPDFGYHIRVIHSWGGRTSDGVYYRACKDNGGAFLTYPAAQKLSHQDPFSAACKKLMTEVNIKSEYDYIFIDEAQDFDKNFLNLCMKLTTDGKLVFGADVFQNIFQTTAPNVEDIFGQDYALKSDSVIKVCYRTPCATLLTAHAIGLGIYGQPVQVIRSVEDWKSLGYNPISKNEGEFEEKEKVIVERLKENTPSLYSENVENLVRTHSHTSVQEEAQWVAKQIAHDIEVEGLNPSDILIVCADDKYYKKYFNLLSTELDNRGINIHNINADKYSITDFTVDKKVTYSTIHKAKGNESYSVYIIGCEVLFYNPNVKNRNLLFTAMTRTKGWLTMTGLGEAADNLFKEVTVAKSKFPRLEFDYPDETQLRAIELNLKQVDSPKDQLQMKEMLEKYGEDGIKQMMLDLLGDKGTK